MASDIASIFNGTARRVQFHVTPDVKDPKHPCIIIERDASGALLQWNIPGKPLETVFVPWANIIAIYPS